jgi:hypothetical protein
MPKKTITIKGIVPGTDNLDLSDGGWTKVKKSWKYRDVTWKIDKKISNVTSFLIVGKTPYNPFEAPIPTNFGTVVPLKVGSSQPSLEWEYAIHWKDEDRIVYIFDPKISILP